MEYYDGGNWRSRCNEAQQSACENVYSIHWLLLTYLHEDTTHQHHPMFRLNLVYLEHTSPPVLEPDGWLKNPRVRLTCSNYKSEVGWWQLTKIWLLQTNDFFSLFFQIEVGHWTCLHTLRIQRTLNVCDHKLQSKRSLYSAAWFRKVHQNMLYLHKYPTIQWAQTWSKDVFYTVRLPVGTYAL